jgi:poly(A) polymerase
MNPDPPPSALRDAAKQAVQRLQTAGFTAYWAGGCVRDTLMGRQPKDYDIATNATPDQVAALFPDSVMVGKSFGVVRAPLKGIFMEVATFRKDISYSDGRRPDEVSFSDPLADAERRDFTINAMFYDPLTDRILDYVGGRQDLDARVVRFVGEPAARIREDHLRMFRAARFASTLDFSLDPKAANAIRENASLASGISAERTRDELTRLLQEARRAGEALAMLDDLGLLEIVLPEVAALKNQPQPPKFHPEGDVFRHTVLMLNLMESRSLALVWSVLLHDVGKPGTVRSTPERLRFDGHAEHGAEMAKDIMRRLRFSNDDIGIVASCVHNHMKTLSVRQMRQSTLRKLAGASTFPLDLELHRLDCLASHGDLGNYEFLLNFSKQVAAEPILPAPWVKGDDLMAMGIPAGREVGRWKSLAYDAQLEERFHTREDLLRWLAGEIAKSAKPD